MGKVIIPVDFSETSDNAFEFAKRLAKEFNASLEAMHVYKLTANSSNNSANLTMYLDLAKRKLNEYIANKEKGFAQKIKKEFLIGFPGDKIIDYTEKQDDASIVMGTAGQKDIIRNIFGSVTTKVGMKSKIPVWIIPPNSEYKTFKKIAFCTNDPSGDLGIDYIINQLSEKYNSEVHFLNVFEHTKINHKKIKQEWSTVIPEDKLKFKTLYEADIVDALYDYCEENDIDLIIINRRHRTFLSMMFNKSVTKKMIIKSNIPLLVTHSITK